MPKCKRCNKKGLFLKLSSDGKCSSCVYEELLENKDKIIAKLEFQLLPEQRDIAKLTAEIKILTTQQPTIRQANEILLKEQFALKIDIQNKKTEIIILDDEILYQSFGLYTTLYNFAKSEEYKDRLEQIRQKQKALVKADRACNFSTDWTLNGSIAQGRKMTKDNVKQILRCFNSECDELVDKVKFSNIESIRERISKSYDQLNKINNLNKVYITPTYRNLKIDELNLAYEYQCKKHQEKEELKEQRAALREQAKLDAEIREAREKIEKDRKHFKKAIADIEYKLKFAINENELADLKSKSEELQNQVFALDNEEKKVSYREANAKAGYVYVISNIGAFGENIYKIGMTRRLEPLDRIDELGSASVPFNFDIHTMIFSDNAPELEAKLHKHFEKGRINKVNNRKEFYKADINEIEQIIKESYDKTIEVLKTPEAEQYRESLKMEK